MKLKTGFIFFSLAIDLLTCPGLRAGGSPFSASSVYNDSYLTEFAFDGNPKTRWASRSGTQWIGVDFGKTVSVKNIAINWERAFAINYNLQVSDDAKSWKTIHCEQNSSGGIKVHEDLSGKGRYFRILCKKPTRWGLYSIWEIEFKDPEVQKILENSKKRAEEKHRIELLSKRKKILKIFSKMGIERIVFAARDDGVDPHWYANFAYYAEDKERKCYRSQGRLCILNLSTGKLEILIDDPDGSVRDPFVHYDAGKILFSWRKSGTEQFHLYEINVNGRGLKQLTHGKYDDIEPVYLPCGDIMFISSRCRRWVNCWVTQVGVLYRCDKNGGNIHQISANIEHDNTPWVLPDGRVIYQRWEYIDRSQVHYHHLWTADPDGTGQMVYFGNLHPGTVMLDAKPIPGTDRVVSIFSPGHGIKDHSGFITEVSIDSGPDNIQSAVRISHSANFRDPYPLSKDLFLAAQGKRMMLVNRQGTALELFSLPRKFGTANLQEPRPIIKRKRERIIPPRVNPEEKTGELILVDAYFGRNMKGVKRGEIKDLLLLEALPKPINFTGGMEPMSYGGTFTLERIVGTVPVEKDGSAYFKLPANRSFFFIALDKNQSSVKRMQSFCSVAPGETTSCIGCHENRIDTPMARQTFRQQANQNLLALKRPPSIPEPVPGIPDVIDYSRDIQPVWDKHCVNCHNPGNRKGGVLMTGDQGPIFSHSYFTLSALRQVSDGRNLPVSNYAPRKIGDSASPLMEKLLPSHHDVKLSKHEIKLVRFWIHEGAPWLGTYAGLGCGMIGGYYQNQIDRRDLNWPSVKAAQKVLQTRCMKCHRDQSKPLPDSPSDNMGMMPWTIIYGSPKLKFSRHILYNLTHPEQSALLLAPLAKKAGGWGMHAKDKNGNAIGDAIEIFKDTNDPGYRTLLKSIQAAKKELDRIKRFNMPGFKPRPQYIREMKRYGVLPESFDLAKDPIDVYKTDREYWKSLWYKPERKQ